MLLLACSRRYPRRWKISHRHLFLRFGSLLSLSMAAVIFLAPLSFAFSPPDAGAKQTPLQTAATAGQTLNNAHEHAEKSGTGGIDSFIIELKNGVSTCRLAGPEEVILTLPRPDDHGTPIKINYLPASNANLVSPGGENVSGPLTINLVALSQLDSDPDKATVIAAFQRAAANWTARIKSPTTVTLNVDYGPNTPGGQPFEQGILGSTSSRAVQIDYPGLRTNLIASATNNPAEANIYAGLPSSVVPTDTGNGAVATVNRTVARQLGLPVPSTPTDDATIGFNKGVNGGFDFNPDDGITTGTTDFVAVATHEIGHALGFTSGNGQGSTASVRVWDLFRFSPPMSPAIFTTAPRTMSLGGVQVYFTGQTFPTFTVPTSSLPPTQNGTTLELGLSTGGPSGTGGDGRQSSHWKADEQSGTFVGIMDPTLARGVRENPTENDFSMLETIGWDLTGNAPIPPPPPPPPAPPNDNFANAQVLNGCAGSVTGTNVGATKEGSEPNSTDSPGSTRSVWYQWQASRTGNVTIDTIGSGFDTVLEVFTGSTLGGLTSIAHNDDNEDPNTTEHEVSSLVTFAATQGTTYRIMVNGFNNGASGGDIGNFKLNWAQTCTPPPTILTEPGTNVVAALDSVTHVRGPFTVTTPHNFSADGQRRIIFFTTELEVSQGASLSGLSVIAQGMPLTVEAAGPWSAVPGMSYIVVRLTGLTPGTYPVIVTISGVNSTNSPTITITSQ